MSFLGKKRGSRSATAPKDDALQRRNSSAGGFIS
jgi:hypothetical protein